MHDCWKCFNEFDQCVCGQERETYASESDGGPVCPECGEVTEANDESGLFSEDTTETTCDHCGKEFRVSVHISYTWSCTMKPATSPTGITKGMNDVLEAKTRPAD